jgi:hypothetical protein
LCAAGAADQLGGWAAGQLVPDQSQVPKVTHNDKAKSLIVLICEKAHPHSTAPSWGAIVCEQIGILQHRPHTSRSLREANMTLDRGNVLFMLAINLVAASVLYQRLHTMGYVPSVKEMVHEYGERFLPPSHHMRGECGFVNSSNLVITSRRVVLDTGVVPASSECGR